MTPIRIEFRFVTPIRVPTHPIHLDALLAWAAVDRADEDGADNPLEAQERLPLEIHRGGGEWVWKASQLVFRGAGPRWRTHLIRRFDAQGYARDKGRVYKGGPNRYAPGTGPYKAYSMTAPLQQYDGAVAWAIGETDSVRELLSRIETVGKLGRLDCGRIGALDVVEDSTALERWKIRAMPEHVARYREAWQTLRPPYWRRAERKRIWVPSAEVVRELR